MTAALLIAGIVIVLFIGAPRAAAAGGAGRPGRRAHAAVAAWRRDQISRRVCEPRATQALKTGRDAQLAAAVAACAKVR